MLLALTQDGMSREDAYAAVQRNAMEVWRGEGRFLAICSGRPGDAGSSWPTTNSTALFDIGYHTKHVDTIFKRVFGRRWKPQETAIPSAARDLGEPERSLSTLG